MEPEGSQGAEAPESGQMSVATGATDIQVVEVGDVETPSVAELLAELQQVQARADAMEAILGHHGITVLESAEYDSANSSDEDSDSIPARDAEGGVGEGAEGTDGAADATLTLGPLDINPESYYTDGYLHIPKFLDEELSRGMRRLLLEPFGDGEWQGSARVCPIYDEQCAGIDASNPHGLRFLQQLLLVDPAWLKLATHPRLIEVATTLLGPDVNLHHAKASLKPPGHVSRQSWHQDAYYLYEDPPDFLTILIYLDATAKAAGATKLVGGSHQNGLILHPPTDPTGPSAEGAHVGAGRREDGVQTGGTIAEDVAAQLGPAIEPEMAIGDAMVLSPFVVHSVGDNHTSTTKVALAFAYKAASAVDREPGGNWRAFAELPVARDGQPAISFHSY
eukprot:m.23677 g.23677  ORF g.23677 m.23677 type:complete len:393 (-) comp5985_c0_seq1:131-1309(-)